jgi:hypothetical protein
MVQLQELRWTTRAEVCATLWQWLTQLSPELCEPEGQPEEIVEGWRRARALYFLLADETCLPTLRPLLLDRQADRDVRLRACRTLLRLKSTLPTEDLEDLLQDRLLWEGSPDIKDLAELYFPFRSEEAQRIARSFLDGRSALDRARLLAGSIRPCEPPPSGWLDWLYDRWLNQDRLVLEEAHCYEHEPMNPWLAYQTSERPESLRLLVDYWRRAEGDWRTELRDRLWDFDAGVPAAWVVDAPEDLRELAEALRLTDADLIDYFGPETLLARIEAELRRISRDRRDDPEDYSALHTTEFLRMVSLMTEWPGAGARERIRSLFCDPEIDTEVRWEFCYNLWEERRAELLERVLAAAREAGDLTLAERVLRWVVDDPRPQDRELLQWAAWHEGRPMLTYWALRGLEALGEESTAWRERLETLSRSDEPLLRLQATAALVRRGDDTRLPEIVRDATEAEDACVRGEAVRMLGTLDAAQHLSLLERALWEQSPVFIPEPEDGPSAFLPAAEEAALALARLRTPEALTALLQAYLRLPDCGVQWWVDDLLEDLVARWDGREHPSFDAMPWESWRQERFGRLR